MSPCYGVGLDGWGMRLVRDCKVGMMGEGWVEFWLGLAKLVVIAMYRVEVG